MPWRSSPKKRAHPRCDACKDHACPEGKDCFHIGDEFLRRYREDPELPVTARAAAEVESEYHGRATRLEEIVHFARKSGFTHLGLAFCAGFRAEARVVGELLRKSFRLTSVCCKIAAVSKKAVAFPPVHPGVEESMCNPVAQAEMSNRAGTELNIVLGLCVGHDAIFNKYARALVTTLVVKDRVLAHNPAGAIYCPYVPRRIREGVFSE